MAVAGSILVVVAVVIHVALFAMQSASWTTSWHRFGVEDADEAETVRPIVYQQGFFHLFLAAGAGLGLFFSWTKLHDAGMAMMMFSLGCMILGAVVLATMGRHHLGLALVQGVVPLVALVLIASA